MSNELTTISAPLAQAVVSTEQRALRMFPTMAKPAEKPVANQADIAAAQATIAAWEAQQTAETAARMEPQDIANATRLYNHFKSPQLDAWAAENGLRGNVWVADFLGRVWNHIEKLESQLRTRR